MTVPHVLRSDWWWKETPRSVRGPHRSLHNRWERWYGMGVLARVFQDLAQPCADRDTFMIDSTSGRGASSGSSGVERLLGRGAGDLFPHGKTLHKTGPHPCRTTCG